jgi:hypothetical protein
MTSKMFRAEGIVLKSDLIYLDQADLLRPAIKTCHDLLTNAPAMVFVW